MYEYINYLQSTIIHNCKIWINSVAQIGCPQTTQYGGSVGWKGAQVQTILRFVVGSFELNFILLTEDIILETCYKIWSKFADNYRGIPVIMSGYVGCCIHRIQSKCKKQGLQNQFRSLLYKEKIEYETDKVKPYLTIVLHRMYENNL